MPLHNLNLATNIISNRRRGEQVWSAIPLGVEAGKGIISFSLFFSRRNFCEVQAKKVIYVRCADKIS